MSAAPGRFGAPPWVGCSGFSNRAGALRGLCAQGLDKAGLVQRVRVWLRGQGSKSLGRRTKGWKVWSSLAVGPWGEAWEGWAVSTRLTQ